MVNGKLERAPSNRVHWWCVYGGEEPKMWPCLCGGWPENETLDDDDADDDDDCALLCCELLRNMRETHGHSESGESNAIGRATDDDDPMIRCAILLLFCWCEHMCVNARERFIRNRSEWQASAFAFARWSQSAALTLTFIITHQPPTHPPVVVTRVVVC